MVQYTSAGRLLSEMKRAKGIFLANPQKPLISDKLEPLFARHGTHWTRGVDAYQRLVKRTRADVRFMSEDRQPRYNEAIDVAAQVISPNRYNTPAKDFAGQVLKDLHIERLEAMDEKLEAVGQAFDFEHTRAAEMAAELGEIIAGIAQGEQSQIDEFILRALRELRSALELFALYGPEGVEAAVAMTVGTLAMAVPLVAPSYKRELVKVARIVKGCLDLVTYAVTAKEAVSMSAGAIKILENFGR